MDDDKRGEDQLVKNRREALLKEYGEVCNNFRILTDVRFKMLALLPIASVAATTLITSQGAVEIRGLLSLFGLAATIGIITYNARNDELYDELVKRAASIERSVGLPDGAFANRPRAWLSLGFGRIKWQVNHRTGIAMIYAASIAVWLAVLFTELLRLPGRQGYEYLSKYLELGIPNWVSSNGLKLSNIVALVLAVVLTSAGIEFVKRQKKHRNNKMELAAARAVAAAADAFAKTDRTHFLAPLDEKDFVNYCVTLSEEDGEIIRKRAEFLTNSGSVSDEYFLSNASTKRVAAQFVAILTDLSPGWLYDCATDRRGDLLKHSRGKD